VRVVENPKSPGQRAVGFRASNVFWPFSERNNSVTPGGAAPDLKGPPTTPWGADGSGRLAGPAVLRTTLTLSLVHGPASIFPDYKAQTSLNTCPRWTLNQSSRVSPTDPAGGLGQGFL
jgi:hypothetical protein